MLTIKYRNLDEVLVDYAVLKLEDVPNGANFVMYDGDAPVALWRMSVSVDATPCATVEKVYFLESVEEGDKLFFVHAIFFKLIEGAPLMIKFNGVHDTLKRFGFEEIDGNMVILSKNINLHYRCMG